MTKKMNVSKKYIRRMLAASAIQSLREAKLNLDMLRVTESLQSLHGVEFECLVEDIGIEPLPVLYADASALCVDEAIATLNLIGNRYEQ